MVACRVKITDDKGLRIHPLDHAITTKFYLYLRHHAMNLVQFMITAINLDLLVGFYGSASRIYFENVFF